MTHKVKHRETLTSIAKLYSTTVGAIVALNGLADPDKIKVGQVLKIPEPENNKVYNALVTLLDAIEAMPEYKTLMEMIGK